MAVGPLLLYGCAATTVGVPPGSERPRGTIAARPGTPGLVVGAPHATSEAKTGDIATAVARRTGFGLVVASGSGLVDEAYARRVREAAQGPLRFYVEIHAHDRAESAGQIEIATVGIDRELAQRLRALAELIRDAQLRSHRDVPRLDVRVEPADTITHAASDARRSGSLTVSERALHIELPRVARRDFRTLYTAIVAEFVAQAVALPPGR